MPAKRALYGLYYMYIHFGVQYTTFEILYLTGTVTEVVRNFAQNNTMMNGVFFV